MVHVRGIARIRHSVTAEVYEIDADEIDFQDIGSDERGMGPETTYSADVHHPQLGQLLWQLWEYPVGVENYRETDIGSHVLLEDFDFGIEGEPLEDNPDDNDHQSRTQSLVEWFFNRFEDPAHRLPYVSAEGGYQWIYGGPYDAREEIEGNFPNEAEDIIDAAVDEIESEGLTEWAPVPSPEDYDEYEPSGEKDLSEIVRELDDLISGIPTPATGPVFKLGEDGLVYMDVVQDPQPRVGDGDLLEELRSASAELRRSLAGTNTHLVLLQAVQNYEAVLLEDTISVSRLYGRGVRLENAAQSSRRSIESEGLSDFTAETEQNLDSVLDLHATFIMSEEVGRRLVHGAAAYRRTPDETAVLKKAAEQVSSAVDQRSDVFSEEIRKHLAQVAQDVGDGPHPERSNQVAVTSVGNMTAVLLKWTSGVALGAVVGGSVATSVPGTTMIAGGASAISEIASFLASSAPSLLMFAVAAGSNLSWLTPIAHLLNKLCHSRRK